MPSIPRQTPSSPFVKDLGEVIFSIPLVKESVDQAKEKAGQGNSEDPQPSTTITDQKVKEVSTTAGSGQTVQDLVEASTVEEPGSEFDEDGDGEGCSPGTPSAQDIPSTDLEGLDSDSDGISTEAEDPESFGTIIAETFEGGTLYNVDSDTADQIMGSNIILKQASLNGLSGSDNLNMVARTVDREDKVKQLEIIHRKTMEKFKEQNADIFEGVPLGIETVDAGILETWGGSCKDNAATGERAGFNRNRNFCRAPRNMFRTKAWFRALNEVLASDVGDSASRSIKRKVSRLANSEPYRKDTSSTGIFTEAP